MSNIKDKIKHVVVLMLENRSLDNMMGFLYPDRPEFNGVTPNTYYNKIHATGKVFAKPLPSSLTTGCLKNPSPDPGEGFDHVNTELNITPETPLGDNSGFLRDYFQVTGSAELAPHIMYSYTPEQVPIISTLAKHFAVSDQWFCSAPTETFPNRLYVATGTSAGLLYDGALFDPDFFQYLADLPTVFNMFEDSGKTWKSYFHDVAFNWVLLQDGSFTSPNIDSYELHFQSDLDGDNFPDYAFIEPAYAFFPNDEHPPHDVTAGEALIADVYNRICQSQYWESTLLIITYDEHGGCYDHVTPPPAPPPDTIYSINPPFNFDRYGVRVPAVFISPYISRRTIVRAVPDWNFTLTDLPFDHTTVIKTLTNLFDLKLAATGNNYLTERDRAAPDLFDALTLTDTPDNNPGPLVAPHVPIECYIDLDLSSDRKMKFLKLKALARAVMQAQSSAPKA
ncbi:MAG: alkaline phosphatase family protein [Blastocatellia bacterium]